MQFIFFIRKIFLKKWRNFSTDKKFFLRYFKKKTKSNENYKNLRIIPENQKILDKSRKTKQKNTNKLYKLKIHQATKFYTNTFLHTTFYLTFILKISKSFSINSSNLLHTYLAAIGKLGQGIDSISILWMILKFKFVFAIRFHTLNFLLD